MMLLRDRRFLIANGGLLIIVVVLAVFGIQTVVHQASASTGTRSVTATLGTVSSSVSATGNVASGQSSSFGFQTGGTVTEIDVAIGQQVAAGAVLAKLNPATAQTNLTVIRGPTCSSCQAPPSPPPAGPRRSRCWPPAGGQPRWSPWAWSATRRPRSCRA